MASYTDHLQPVQDPPPDDLPATTIVYTGPFLSADASGNVVLGAALVTSSFAAPTGASSVNFSSAVIVGSGGYPPSSSSVAPEIPLHQTLGLVQASSLLISDFSSNAVFYATSNQPPLYTGPVAHVFGDLLVDGTIHGPSGAYSQVGPQGPVGSQGDQGPVGSQGPQGPVGSQGDQGPVGSQGPQGPVGSQGDQGPVGSQGVPGPVGSQGVQGPVGSQGPQGPVGSQGAVGPVGSQGAAGTSYTGPTGSTPNLSGYLTTTSAAATYLTQTTAASTYATQTTVNAISTNLTNDNYGFWFYPYLAGWVHGNSTNVSMSQTYVNNAGTLTLTRNNVGNYTVGWTNALSKPFVLLTPYWQNSSSTNIVVGLQGWNTTSFTVQIRVMNTATAAEGDFIFMVMP